MRKILSIAGSDCSGGAGIQGDLKTIAAHGMYGMSVITSLTAQNTMGIHEVFDLPSEFVAKELDAIFNDIYPDAIKIGMVSNREIIEVIIDRLLYYRARNIVIDPVMISTSGRKILNDDAIERFCSALIPLATILTPNISEAEFLSEMFIETKKDMEQAAVRIGNMYDCHILIKGGHLKDSSDDLLYTNKRFFWYEMDNINNPNTHGTGCALSTAIACNIGENMELESSISSAKDYITGAIKSNLKLGMGNGPLNHSWKL